MDLFGYPNPGVDDNKMNSHYQSLLKHNSQDEGGEGNDVQDNPHDKPTNGQNPTGPMKGKLMNWTKMLEAMDELSNSVDEQISSDDGISSMNIEEPSAETDTNNGDDDDLLNQLDQIFTPILIMQGFEGDISDQIKEAYSEASVLTERTMISFDDSARMAQLISVCALLLSRKKNSEKYRMYAKAAEMKNKMKLEIQKEEYAEAKALAQKYLVKVSTTNNSSVARGAARDLLPETQH